MRRNSLDVKSLNQRNLNTSDSEISSPDTNKTINADHHRYMNGGNIINSHSFNDRGDTNEIVNIHRHDMRRESLLDDLCDSLADKNSHYSSNLSTTATITRIKKLEFIGGGGTNHNSSPLTSNGNSNETHNGNNHSKSNGCVVNGRLDEKKKTKLLAALKNIDNNGSSLEN